MKRAAWNLKGKPVVWVLLLAAALAVIITFFALFQVNQNRPQNAEVITVSTLEKIIEVSELSTFTAVYNGIAQVAGGENPEEIDYCVSYEARVNAGIDFEKIKITVDNDTQTIQIDLPEVHITEINVDIASLDFMFYDSGADESAVTQEAFAACEADVRQESQRQEAIIELAQQNAVNVITALVKPIVEQLDADYVLVVA